MLRSTGAVSKWLNQAMRGSAFFQAFFGKPNRVHEKNSTQGQCHLVKQMAEEEYLREKMIYRKESHLLFFAVRQKDRWTSASK